MRARLCSLPHARTKPDRHKRAVPGRPPGAPALLLALASAMPAGDAIGQPEPTRTLEPAAVVAVAHRSARPLDDVAPTVTVVTRKDIESGLAFDLREMLRYEPGVAVENHASRFGLGNLAVRGMDGNRVVLLLDGIRLADSYRVGSFSNATREGIDLGLLRKVEIMRGPGSALYGSDALAGVLSFSTLDPSDLAPAGRHGLTVDAAWAGADRSLHRGFVFASRATALEALVGYERSDGHERDNEGADESIGTSRTAANPQDRATESWLGKLVLPTSRAQYRLTLDRTRRATTTEVLSLNPQSSRTVRLDGFDRAARDRASVDVDANDAPGVGPFARVRALLYTQRTLTTNDTLDLRTNTTSACLSATGTVTCLRDVQFRHVQQENGASLLADLDRGARWVLGIEYARIDADEKRSGTQTNLDTGVAGTIVGGERLPTRDFPRSRTERSGAFAQGEFELDAARVALIPALRYDRYRVTPEVDSIFETGNPGRQVVALADRAVSPKLGILWRATTGTTVTANFATGFRAPPAADINIGLSNLPSGYAVIPNPLLRSERSRGGELGVRSRIGSHELTATGFRTDYHDLILSRAALPCPGDPRCVPGATGTFQSINVTRARISGFEATALARLASEWAVRASYSGARGDDLARNQPLNTIEPARLAVGVLYDTPRLGAGAHVTAVRRKHRIDDSTGPYAAAPGFATLDLTAQWRLAPRIRLSLGVFNALDRKYWLWSDLRNAPRPGTSVDRYTQPGRNASLLVRAEL